MDKRVALITGGTKGIGLGIAKVFIQQGYKVALVYRGDKQSAERAVQELKPENARAIQADITDQGVLDSVIEQTQKGLGQPSVLVNNAGILRMGQTLEIKDEDLRAVMECNFFAPLALSKVFADSLIKNKMQGSIVNILSIGAYRGGNLAYCASKAALLCATKSMARDLARHDIRVNSVSPFGLQTELNEAIIKKDPQGWDKMIKKTFLKRESQPEEIGDAVYYLATEKASYITGIDLPVDGGYLAS